MFLMNGTLVVSYCNLQCNGIHLRIQVKFVFRITNLRIGNLNDGKQTTVNRRP
jgi:hypothetical protein